ncbi:hypothetical protein [Paenibacillus sp. CAA11]|uniref:hypothetical protein n=1 Tax=Paenibacillus sp. CAA11 TaxID=1532905 RepID=UPI00131F418F|nr:hypothetical protein [Paenibacillus sp. CAA11]
MESQLYDKQVLSCSERLANPDQQQNPTRRLRTVNDILNYYAKRKQSASHKMSS